MDNECPEEYLTASMESLGRGVVTAELFRAAVSQEKVHHGALKINSIAPWDKVEFPATDAPTVAIDARVNGS